MSNPIILADNRMSDGTPTATDTETGYDVLNIRDLKTFTSWKAASSGTKYITVDCGSAKNVDALGIMKHTLGTAAASVSVESSSTGAWAGEQTERLAAFVPTTDKAILKTFTTASAQYWRVKIVTASVAPEIAVLMIGVRLTFPYPPESPFRPVSESIEAESVRSKTGQRLGTIVRYHPYKIDARWTYLLRSWIDSDFLSFWNDWASELSPFFWAWDITTYPADVRWVTVDQSSSFEPSVSTLTYYDELTLRMEGVRE